jgi:hypothetical protein
MRQIIQITALQLLFVCSIFVSSCNGKDDDNGIKRGHYLFGTLMTSPDRAQSQAEMGINCASFTMRWDQFEPSENAVNQTYIDGMKVNLQKLKDAGMNVVLDFGIHYPPIWVTQLPDCRYINQYGDQYIVTTTSGLNTLNGVFNKNVRAKMASYVDKFFEHFEPSDFFAIRIGWGYYAELHYPDKGFNGRTNCYWGFDPIALGQKPELLPEGMETNPVPDWRPGTPSENHTKARQFIEWYLDCLTDFQSWQIKTLRKHYSGYINALYADWGVRPGEIDEAVEGDLNGGSFTEQYGQLNKGYDHGRFIAAIGDEKVIPFNTCLNSTYPYPMTSSIVDDNGSDPRYWSPIHYVAWCAGKNPLPLRLWAENDGNDTYHGMALSFKRMTRYNLMGIMWAFEHQLYEDNPAYAQIQEYAKMISQYSL